MTTSHADHPSLRKPLRLWPGVVAAVLQVLATVALPVLVPGVGGASILAGLALALAVFLWWLVFSRAPWSERLGAVVLMVAAVFATRPLLHASIRTGMMGMMFVFSVIPVLSLALVVWAVAARRLPARARRAWMAGAVVIACGVFTLLRTDGITGDADSDLEWRWTPSAEERLLAQSGDERLASASGGSAGRTTPAAPPVEAAPDLPPDSSAEAVKPLAEPSPASAGDARTARAGDSAAMKAAEWPGFRGPARDGVVREARIDTDWSTSPPVALWRRAIGPGWSSFAVRGDLVYTQEQRGEDEIVSCYRLSTGEPVWRHGDRVRFWESNAGAGPRATPAVHGGRVYTLGATGIVNALDARSGAVVWSRNAAADTGTGIPEWGFAGSPLVVDDLVVVAVGGQLAAYEAATGRSRWHGPAHGGGYASPHLVTMHGTAQILLLSGGGAISVAPADGTLLWEHPWVSGVGMLQPALAPGGDVLITAGDGMGGTGVRRVSVTSGTAGWSVAERWTSRGLKPYFNDFVVHEGHAYGFDGSILASIALEDGTRTWKGGRYGHGQLLLLPDQDLLLVLSEDGELALVSATPDRFAEIARLPGIEGKTWNHPVLVGDVLLVRNGEQMAAFRLARGGR